MRLIPVKIDLTCETTLLKGTSRYQVCRDLWSFLHLTEFAEMDEKKDVEKHLIVPHLLLPLLLHTCQGSKMKKNVNIKEVKTS